MEYVKKGNYQLNCYMLYFEARNKKFLEDFENANIKAKQKFNS